MGDLHKAQQHISESLQIAAEIGTFVPIMDALASMALLLADQGEKQRAVELYALVSRCPYVAKSRWFEDTIGKHIAAVAATLPPDVVTAVQERGRGRDLDATVAELLVELEE
jgi:hypothetical protein